MSEEEQGILNVMRTELRSHRNMMVGILSIFALIFMTIGGYGVLKAVEADRQVQEQRSDMGILVKTVRNEHPDEMWLEFLDNKLNSSRGESVK